MLEKENDPGWAAPGQQSKKIMYVILTSTHRELKRCCYCGEKYTSGLGHACCRKCHDQYQNRFALLQFHQVKVRKIIHPVAQRNQYDCMTLGR